MGSSKFMPWPNSKTGPRRKRKSSAPAPRRAEHPRPRAATAAKKRAALGPPFSDTRELTWAAPPSGGGRVDPVAEEDLGFLGVERTGEEEALAAVAGLALQQRELVQLLDPLGEGLQRERLAELDEGVDQGLALAVLAQTGDEGAVD